MTHAIDPSFRLRKEAQAARRRRGLRLKALAAFGVLAVAAAGAAFYRTADQWSFGDLDEDLVPLETSDDVPEGAPVYVPAILDLAGDPMWISVAQEAGGASRVRSLDRPEGLAATVAAPQVEVLSDAMLSASERFMTTIPSSQEDFAFFEAQRAPAPSAGGSVPAGSDDVGDTDGDDLAPPDTPGSEVAGAPSGSAAAPAADEEAGWGETISAGEEALPSFRRTAVENNTTVATVVPEGSRFLASEDFFVRVLTRRGLEGVVIDNRFSADDARKAGEALKSVFKLDGLEAGYVVALRGARAGPEEPALRLMQVSIYARDTFIGTLARDASGTFVLGADPWVSDDLFHYSGDSRKGGPKRQYRLLDAIYSTAARNNVPTAVIGETIMMLSRGEDLDAFATDSDRLVLVYSAAPRGKDGVSGRVLYAGVQGAEKALECFVFPQSDGKFACVTGNDRVRSLTVSNGMVTPVNGVMTSTFGPRMHPILKTVRVHKGVDWAAPVGTPVVAAFAGQIAFAGDGGSYGNLVKITHPEGRETRYAHLQRFAPSLAVGVAVKAGDVIGTIGTTGLSTGPHLHFELYQAGVAIDPLAPPPVAVAVVTASEPASSDDEAVERLTDRIIHVESGGKAHAKNPLSSATGLGQFIESTWIRMMNTYRPDLARSLSRADLLALRFDPTISREMVRNLAREGEAYLRVRGHKITAGRLYLCHFLGMEGAHQVLAAGSASLLVEVLGPGVIRANPFLTGKSAGYVVAWAEAKMNGRARRVVVTQESSPAPPAEPATKEIRETSPEFDLFKSTLLALLKAQQGAI